MNPFLKKEWHLKWLNKIKGFFFLTIPLSFNLIINLIFPKDSEEVHIDLKKYFIVAEREIKIRVRLPFLLFYYLFSFLFCRNVRNFYKGLSSMIANLTFFPNGLNQVKILELFFYNREGKGQNTKKNVRLPL